MFLLLIFLRFDKVNRSWSVVEWWSGTILAKKNEERLDFSLCFDDQRIRTLLRRNFTVRPAGGWLCKNNVWWGRGWFEPCGPIIQTKIECFCSHTAVIPAAAALLVWHTTASSFHSRSHKSLSCIALHLLVIILSRTAWRNPLYLLKIDKTKVGDVESSWVFLATGKHNHF